MRRTMSILLAFMLVLFIFVPQSIAKDVSVSFAWDADDSPSTSLRWEEIRMYTRMNNDIYDYTKYRSIPQSYTLERSTPTTFTDLWTVPDGELTTLSFVLRAVNGEILSADSEEVSLTVDLTTLLPVQTFEAVYNDVTKTIDMVWDNGNDRTIRWEVFMSDTKGGPYSKFDEVLRADATSPVTSSKEFIAPEGVLTRKFFVVVSYGAYDVFSADSQEVEVVIDKRTINNVVNFRIVVK